MALTLTEALIRSRVNLSHENLEDIKSLSLPGTYHEKIVSIGTSLRRFTRLKSLDLSRNALESLQGLEHLQMIEKLNLYYNNVSSLEELKRLKHNTNLKEIDLRLNPVTRNEPDYRLYLIHMLPNLQKLDDRAVRDRERQAALMHFSSSQTLEMTSLPTQPQADTKSPNPRTEMMAKLMKCSIVDDDDSIVDIVNRQNGDLGKPRPLTGSSAREDKCEDYTLNSLKTLDLPKSTNHRGKTLEDTQAHMVGTVNTEPPSLPKNEDPRLARYKEWYPNIMSVPGEGVHKIGEAYKKDPNLLFSDEVEASSKYRGQGYFTPNPKGESEQPKPERVKYQDTINSSDPVPKSDRSQFYSAASKQRQSRPDFRVRTSQDDMAWTRPRLNRTNSVPAREDTNSLNYGDAKEKTLVYSLLNLVDRYWNGSKSLHKHPKFIEQAIKYLSEYTLTREHVKEDEANKLRRRVEILEEEIAAVGKLKEGSAGETAATKEAELRAALKKSHEDIKRMHSEIRHYISENRILHRKLDVPNFSSNCDNYDNGSGQSMTVDELQYQNDVISHELELMKAKVKQYSQLQDLASMLQESHKSLVETNNHLLQELNETKDKHQQEIEQMHWSYNQLKSTLGYSSMLKSFAFSQNNSNIDSNQTPAVSSYKEYQGRDGLGVDKSHNRLSDTSATKT